MPLTLTGEQIRAVRHRAGITQKHLAAELGVHMREISRWENGEVQVPRTVSLAIIFLYREATRDVSGVADRWREGA